MVADSLARARLARAAARYGTALPSLILMTDDERLADPMDAARVLPKGSLIIVRARDAVRRENLAHRLRAVARSRSLLLSIANDAALASRVGAHGLHLSEKSVGEAAHWRALRPGWFITCAAHSLSAALRAHRSGADAVLLSPVFATQSHPARAGFGPLRTRLIAAQLPGAMYGLGGVDAVSARRLEGACLAGLAGISALAPPHP